MDLRLDNLTEKEHRAMMKFHRELTSPFRPLKRLMSGALLVVAGAYAAYVGVQAVRLVKGDAFKGRVHLAESASNVADQLANDKQLTYLVAGRICSKAAEEKQFRDSLDGLRDAYLYCDGTSDEFGYELRRTVNPLAKR